MIRPITLVAMTALALTACDWGPSGPGTIDAVVEAPQALGAVVLEFVGGGVEGFDPQGGTQVYSALVSAADSTYRVILVSPDGSSLRFGVRVIDVRNAQPVVTAVSAVSPANATLTALGIQLRLER